MEEHTQQKPKHYGYRKNSGLSYHYGNYRRQGKAMDGRVMLPLQ